MFMKETDIELSNMITPLEIIQYNVYKLML